jgi:murein DD-endopeptidase MepM/ murein hydrolase activator NlpD
MYMHLSSIWVNEGELVKRGQYVGLSGQTGYALAPHLHLTIRQDDVSIDPETFLKLFK